MGHQNAILGGGCPIRRPLHLRGGPKIADLESLPLVIEPDLFISDC